MANGERIRELLQLEQAGNLTTEQQDDIATLRQAKQFPPALSPQSSTAPAPRTTLPGFSEPAQTFGQRVVRGAAPSIIGGALGAVLGSAVAPGPGTLLGTALGAGVGEAATQYLDPLNVGIQRPDPTQIGLAMAVPMPIKGASAVGRGIVKGFAGRELASEAGQAVAQRRLLPGPSADELFAAVQGTRVTIQPTRTRGVVANILQHERQQAATSVRTAIEEALGPLETFVQTPQSSSVLFEESKRVRQMASAALEGGHMGGSNIALGRALNDVRAAMLDDLAQGGVPVVKAAVARYRKEQAVAELAKLMTKPKPSEAFRVALHDDPLFGRSFAPGEIQQIAGLMRRLGTVPPSGFRGVLGRTILGGGGAVAGTGTDLGAAGSAAGAAIGFALPEVIAMTLATRPGRKVLEAMLDQGAITPSKAVALGQFARTMFSEEGQAGP